MKKIRLQNAFTLIELLVVISIIGLLSSIVLASLNVARSKARDTQRISDIKQIQSALEMYHLDHGEYPVGDDDGDIWQAYSRGSEWLQNDGFFRKKLEPYINLPIDPLNKDTSDFTYGSYMYMYIKNPQEKGYFLCAALEKPASSENPIPNNGGYYSYYILRGEPGYMFNGGYCVAVD